MPAITDAQRRALELVAERRVYRYRPWWGYEEFGWCCRGHMVPSASTMDELEGLGYVTREDEDAARRTHATLTDAGRAVLAERGDA